MRARVSVVREVLTVPESSDDWRWKARRVLSRFGPRAIPALVEALCVGEDPTIRRFAADSLGRLGSDASVREAALAALDAVEGAGSSQ